MSPSSDERPVAASQGLISLAAHHSVAATLDRLVAAIEAKGMTVFCRIDHAGNAREAGLELRATELLIFGNAKGGTPLMQASQPIGIDLPLKALAWEDADGRVWLSYNDPAWLAARHGLDVQAGTVVAALRGALAAVTKTAAMP